MHFTLQWEKLFNRKSYFLVSSFLRMVSHLANMFPKKCLPQYTAAGTSNVCPPHSECSPVLSPFLQYELWVALWYSECVKRKAVYQHVSLVVAACHPCRLLTLFIAFLPVLAALSECMKHDGTCIVIWPLHCYDLLYLAWTIFLVRHLQRSKARTALPPKHS